MIYQLVHTLSYGDAISGEVLALHRTFQSQGTQSEIYAINIHPEYRSIAKDYQSFPRTCSGEIILHYSLGSPLNDLYRSVQGVSKTLIYHNLTPSRWFQGINPRIVKDIEDGVRELPQLCRISDRIIADSKFNASEIQAIGCSAEVLLLPFDPERWKVARREGIYSMLKADSTLHVLHVGRIAPNKRIEDIIKTFYFLHHHINKDSRLWLCGIDIDTELYSFALKRLIHEFHLENVVQFTGGTGDEEIRAFYEGSSVYLCMSEHEGFCLPLVEAMHFGLPVVAYDSSAVPETLGNGGILVSEKRDAEIAELINKIHTDSALREKMISTGKKRVEDFSYDLFSQRVKEIFTVKNLKRAQVG